MLQRPVHEHVRDDPVADRDVLDALADLVDDAGSIAPEDDREPILGSSRATCRG
jgi:hypothetical protein